MTEEELRFIAQQLRQPHGEHASEVAHRMNQSNNLINKQAISELKVEPGDCVLEIGMGNGHFVKDLLALEKNMLYYGCDFSKAMIEEARRINHQYCKDGTASFDFGKIEELPYQDDFFDKIFSVNTIYFWENIPAAIDELKRVLKPAGKLVLGLRPKSTMETYPFVKFGFKMFTGDEVIDLLSRDLQQVLVQKLDEPNQTIDGVEVSVQSLLVTARKNS